MLFRVMNISCNEMIEPVTVHEWDLAIFALRLYMALMLSPYVRCCFDSSEPPLELLV